MANALAHETSPYLLQHAHNPVHWLPWGDEALKKAQQENKLILVSIGYSACHWCHVMEHESFEDPAVAALMNEHYVSIKVDREERPDVDAVYMEAVQLMRSQGGWPLNCFCLPDGRPIYGGTYFPKPQWLQVLKDLAAFYQQDPQKAQEYAGELTKAINELDDYLGLQAPEALDAEDTTRVFVQLHQRFDAQLGGLEGAPKFPTPSVWDYLLRYSHLKGSEQALQHVQLTLDRMAHGGIYDHLGGGFARYSVDSLWRVPHFEKMLYDNAQLVSLYTHAWQKTHTPRYQQVVQETLAFIERELTHASGGFYSALDADSEGVEGKFYVWSAEEVSQLLGNDAGLFMQAYGISKEGNWEGVNILHRPKPHAELAQELGLGPQSLEVRLAAMRQVLYEARAPRIRPGLDDKVLTSWNGLMTTAYADAYLAFGDEQYLAAARKNQQFIEQHLADGPRLLRSWKATEDGAGQARINAYLEDYAFNLQALIRLYEATWDEQLLHLAEERLAYLHEHFYDEASGYYFYTSKEDTPLIARKRETHDSVLPSSNAALAHVLLSLSHLLAKPEYEARARTMLLGTHAAMLRYPSSHTHWASLLLRLSQPEYELAICGPEAKAKRAELGTHYLPHVLLAGQTTKATTLAILEHKYPNEGTLLYACQKGACQRPTTELAHALQHLSPKA